MGLGATGSEPWSASSIVEKMLRETGGVAVIDGGLATELERHGADLNDPLWSAKCLISSPNLIRQVHLDYLEAGANIIISSSYQATIQGFQSKGFSKEDGEALLRKSVEIACEARGIYLQRCSESSVDGGANGRFLRKRPILVAASVGSYGAYLADGSEYSGIYGDAVTLQFLKDFHLRRVQVLSESGADLIAFETTPNKLETQAYVEILEENNIKIPAWLSFNSKDGINVVSGDSLVECVSIAESCKKVVAVGINCTPPRFIHGLVLSIRKAIVVNQDRTGYVSLNERTWENMFAHLSQLFGLLPVTDRPILVYPNSGEIYDADKKEWVESTGVSDEGFVSYVHKWWEAGACLVGGCCRTTPNTIRAICRVLSKESAI